MAAETATPTAPAPSDAPAPPVAPPPDPRLIKAAERLARFYRTLLARQPGASGDDLLPGERRGGKCEALVGLGPHVGRSLDYAAALVVAYGPLTVGSWEEAGAQNIIQKWVIDYEAETRWARDPSTGQGPAQYHAVDTSDFRTDYDAVIAAVDAASPRVVNMLLDELAGVLRDTRGLITPQWSAKIHREVESIRAKLLETVPSAKHMREDSYEDVPAYRGDAGRVEFGSKVEQIGDPLLSLLFEQPDGVEVLRALARSPGDGAGRAAGVVIAAEGALRDFRGALGSDVGWRYSEFRPAVLEHLGLARIPGLAEYLSAIGFRFVKRSTVEHVLDAAGFALMALSLIFSGGVGAVVVAGGGVVVSGVGLGVAFLQDQEQARGAQAFAFQKGEKRLIHSRFPVGTAIAAAALLLSAIGFYLAIRGLRVPTAPRVPAPGVTPRPGAPSPSLPPSASPTAPAAKSVGPAARLTEKAAKGTGSRLGAAPPKPAAASPAPQPAPVVRAPETPATPPPLPPRPATPPSAPRPPASEPAPPARASEAPRTPPEQAGSGTPPPNDRAAQRVPPAQRGISTDEEQLARDAIRALDNELARPSVKAEFEAARGRIVALLEELEKVPENAELVRKLEVAAGALENEELYGQLVVAIRRELDAIRNAGVPAAAWEQARYLTTDELRAAARVVGLTEETANDWLVIGRQLDDAEFLPTIASNRVGFIDLAFTQDDHGILTHALQDWIINKALAELNLGTAAELRVLLARAVAPASWVDPRGLSIGANIWGELTDSLGTKGAPPGAQGMYSPEFLTRRLMQFFPGITKPPRLPGTPPTVPPGDH